MKISTSAKLQWGSVPFAGIGNRQFARQFCNNFNRMQTILSHLDGDAIELKYSRHEFWKSSWGSI